MTLDQAKALHNGDYVHHVSKKNADRTPMRARVTSVKVWKTRPAEVEVHVKHGMYDYAVFTARDLDEIASGYSD